MSKRGRYAYIPRELVEELEDIKINFNMNKNSDCFKKIAESSKIARRIEETLGFMRRRKR